MYKRRQPVVLFTAAMVEAPLNINDHCRRDTVEACAKCCINFPGEIGVGGNVLQCITRCITR